MSHDDPLKRYLNLKKIGQGTSGAVYVANDTKKNNQKGFSFFLSFFFKNKPNDEQSLSNR